MYIRIFCASSYIIANALKCDKRRFERGRSPCWYQWLRMRIYNCTCAYSAALETSKYGKSISIGAGRSCPFSGNVWRQSFVRIRVTSRKQKILLSRNRWFHSIANKYYLRKTEFINSRHIDYWYIIDKRSIFGKHI